MGNCFICIKKEDSKKDFQQPMTPAVYPNIPPKKIPNLALVYYIQDKNIS